MQDTEAENRSMGYSCIPAKVPETDQIASGAAGTGQENNTGVAYSRTMGLNGSEKSAKKKTENAGRGDKMYRISVKRTHWHHYTITVRTKSLPKELAPMRAGRAGRTAPGVQPANTNSNIPAEDMRDENERGDAA